MTTLQLYEFSSKVKCYYDDLHRNWIFIEYDVGKFMLNSFETERSIDKTSRGIPQAIDSAIRQNYFKVNTLSYGQIALTGRYLEDDWVVLAVSDRLGGRPNEVYRYFCVQSKLTETVDPMLSLIDWYIKEKPRFNPHERRDFQRREIPASSPSPLSRQGQSQLEESILDVLEETKMGGQVIEVQNKSLNIEELRNIIASFPLKQRKSFSWALDAANPRSLIGSRNFRLVQVFVKNNQGKRQKNLCIIPPLPVSTPVIVATGFSENNRDNNIKIIKDKLKNIPEKPDKIFSTIRNLFKQNLKQEEWPSIFDAPEIAKLIPPQNNSPDPKGLTLLTLQAIFIPDRVSNLAKFIYDYSCGRIINYQKQIEKIYDLERQLRSYLEEELENFIRQKENTSQEFYSFFNSFTGNLYEGLWRCLSDSLNYSDDKFQASRNFLVIQKQTQGLWYYVLTNHVRIDFYDYFVNPENQRQSDSKFFQNLKTLNEEQQRKFLQDIWEGDESFQNLKTLNEEQQRKFLQEVVDLKNYYSNREEIPVVHTVQSSFNAWRDDEDKNVFP